MTVLGYETKQCLSFQRSFSATFCIFWKQQASQPAREAKKKLKRAGFWKCKSSVLLQKGGKAFVGTHETPDDLVVMRRRELSLGSVGTYV
jgi:hypothetical protein